MIYSCYNLVTSDITTVITIIMFQLVSVLCELVYIPKQTSDLFKSQDKESTYTDEQETIST